MTKRSPIFTVRPRLPLGLCHTASFQRMTSASINPLPQGIHSAAMPSAFSFLFQKNPFARSRQGFDARERYGWRHRDNILEMTNISSPFYEPKGARDSLER